MIHFTKTTAALILALSALAVPVPLTPDPAGTKNIGNGNGQQFITGACVSNADCASACCAGVSGSTDGHGVCSGIGAQFEQGKTGCGFVAALSFSPSSSTSPTSTSSGLSASTSPNETTPVRSGVDVNAPGAENVGNGRGEQFITGQCFSDADCSSACCATLNGTGQCSGPDVAFAAARQGCGFVSLFSF